jgi:hypothetical protein
VSDTRPRVATSSRRCKGETTCAIAHVPGRVAPILFSSDNPGSLYTSCERQSVRAGQEALRASIAEAVAQALPHGTAVDGFTHDEVVTLILALSDGLAIERLTDPRTVPDDLFGSILTALPSRH